MCEGNFFLFQVGRESVLHLSTKNLRNVLNNEQKILRMQKYPKINENCTSLNNMRLKKNAIVIIAPKSPQDSIHPKTR